MSPRLARLRSQLSGRVGNRRLLGVEVVDVPAERHLAQVDDVVAHGLIGELRGRQDVAKEHQLRLQNRHLVEDVRVSDGRQVPTRRIVQGRVPVAQERTGRGQRLGQRVDLPDGGGEVVAALLLVLLLGIEQLRLVSREVAVDRQHRIEQPLLGSEHAALELGVGFTQLDIRIVLQGEPHRFEQRQPGGIEAHRRRTVGRLRVGRRRLNRWRLRQRRWRLRRRLLRRRRLADCRHHARDERGQKKNGSQGLADHDQHSNGGNVAQHEA